MESINKLILQGWVENAPAVRYFSYDLVRTDLKLRTEERVRSSKGERTLSLWHRVVAWGEIAKYLGQHVHSGDVIKVYGHIRYHKESDKDGISRLITEVEAVKVELVAQREAQHSTATTMDVPQTNELPWDTFAPTENEDPMA